MADDNVMRHEYRPLTDGEKLQITLVKNMGRDFIRLCDGIGGERGPPGDPGSVHAPGTGTPIGSRELSLAKTKMQEAVFWAVHHITRDR
jgi:hypothetical protein